MNEPAHSNNERLQELLIDRATVGFTPNQAIELDALMRSLGFADDDSYDLTAAAIDAAVAIEHQEILPDRLRKSAMDAAQSFFDQSSSDGESKSLDVHSPLDTGVDAPDHVELSNRVRGEKSATHARFKTNGFPRRELFAITAVAAGLMVAAFIWLGQNDRVAPTVAQRQQQFLTQSPDDLVRVNWNPSGQPVGEGVKGEVLWSNDQQTGFMTFRGLPKNDPTVEQYQLWIFDKERDERYPVDGGVFDVSNPTDETIVAINAKIKVSQATLFAITIEQPGGVVVSDRKRLPVVAAVE